MRIAINTPTGNIGRAAAGRLMERNADLVLLTRSPDKLKGLEAQGVEVRVGDLMDATFVEKATRDVDALFWLTPVDYASNDMRADQNRLADIAAAAIRQHGISRVVTLSSLNAHVPDGNGPIGGLYDVEKKLEETEAHVTHLRPGYFMENYFEFVSTIASDGAIYMPAPAEGRQAMIATVDIGEVAAERLADPEWNGRTVMELVGPAEVTFDEAARTIGEAIGKAVKHVTVTPDQTRQAMSAMGLSGNVIDCLLEMYAGFAAGRIVAEGEPRKTRTSFATFVRDTFAPIYADMTG